MEKNRLTFFSHLDLFRKAVGDETTMRLLDELITCTPKDLSVPALIVKSMHDSQRVQDAARWHDAAWGSYSAPLKQMLVDCIIAKKDSQPESSERILNEILAIRTGPVTDNSLLASLIPQLKIQVTDDELLSMLIVNPFDLFTLELFLNCPLFMNVTAQFKGSLAQIASSIG